jgi:alpha-galactosidase
MPWYFLADDQKEAVAGYGVKVRPGAFCFWQIDPKGISLWMDLRNGGSGVILSGRKLLAAEVVCAIYPQPQFSVFLAAQSFCKIMCTDPIFPPKPVYGANNWYYAYGNSSAEDILQDAAYLEKLTKGLENRPYLVIDDCWQRDRTSDYIGGPWYGNAKFPDMAGLAAQIKQKGVIPGIWVRFLQDHSEKIPDTWRLPHNGSLDPSRPEVLAYVKETIKRLCGWGYRLIKHDFSTQDLFGKWGFEMTPYVTDDGWHFSDRSRTSAEIIVAFYRAILDAAKPTKTVILGCNTVGHLGAGLMHINRTGDDTSGLLWERTARFGVNTLAFRMPQHRTFYDADADCIGITEKIPWKYNRQWGDLLANSGTVFFVSAKPGVLRPSEEQELADFLARASKQAQIAQPLDWEETMLPQNWQVGERTVRYDWYEDSGLRVVQENGSGFWLNRDNLHWF